MAATVTAPARNAAAAAIVVHYPRTQRPDPFSLPLRDCETGSIPDSGVSLAASSPSKMQGVVVTTARRRFPPNERTKRQPGIASLKGHSHGSATSAESRAATAADRPRCRSKAESRPRPQPTGRESGKTADTPVLVGDCEGVKKTLPASRKDFEQRLSNLRSLEPPRTPLLDNLSTPDLSDVDESVWWGK